MSQHEKWVGALQCFLKYRHSQVERVVTKGRGVSKRATITQEVSWWSSVTKIGACPEEV